MWRFYSKTCGKSLQFFFLGGLGFLNRIAKDFHSREALIHVVKVKEVSSALSPAYIQSWYHSLSNRIWHVYWANGCTTWYWLFAVRSVSLFIVIWSRSHRSRWNVRVQNYDPWVYHKCKCTQVCCQWALQLAADLLVRAPDSWSKDCKFESRQERRENFLLQRQLCVLTLMRCPFHPSVTAVARKRPRSFCQKYRWQVTPKHARSGLTMPLTRHSVGTYQETSSHATRQEILGQSSQLAEPLWTDSGLKSGISVRELIST